MASPVQFVPMFVSQQVGFQTLQRTPEPAGVTDADDHVHQYNQAMATKLALGYASALEAVYRARRGRDGGLALDLACGPGHYTLCLARYLGYEEVTGVDLSEPMIELAARNSMTGGGERRVQFRVGDVTNLDHLGGGDFDLTSFTGAAHHMADLETVGRVLRGMDRVTKPDGLVMVMDLARLRTAKLTERYVNTLGRDYAERGLRSFLEDFRNTMYAVWTPGELRTAIPTDSARWWCHIVPWGLPTVQIILGLPVGRKRPFVRSGFRAKEHPLIREWYPRWEQEVNADWARETLSEWKLMRLTLLLASKRMFPPGKD